MLNLLKNLRMSSKMLDLLTAIGLLHDVAVQAFYENLIAFETGIDLEVDRKFAAALPQIKTN